ncbi:MAG: SagB/ThcOx family dehydrogenase [Chloroflexi bacterium]|nr:SagB/ThcOx family dehydrogenase [Chloroflexota bacterium]
MKLPASKRKGAMSVEEALVKRRSERRFAARELSWEQISQLLWSAQGTEDSGLRTAPSAGATYPLEVYLVSSQGVYHYLPAKHEVELCLGGDARARLCEACLGQDCVREAPVSVVVAAVYERTAGGYGSRAARYVHIEVGHAAQNVHLQAVALGLGSVPVGAFVDEQVQAVLRLPDTHRPVYIIPVGYVAA